jgi:hypothetical protein
LLQKPESELAVMNDSIEGPEKQADGTKKPIHRVGMKDGRKCCMSRTKASVVV